jgi:hypothetical protein
MANKNKALSKQRTHKKPAGTGMIAAVATKKTAPPRSAAARVSNVKPQMSLPQDGVPTTCPAHLYDGTVLLDDGARQSFLKTAAATYLMTIDADCSGVFTDEGVDAAYAAFSYNPGRNQRLTCQGFLHEDGTAWVLHVVR